MLDEHLRGNKTRKRHYGSQDKHEAIKGRIGIEQRPAVVDERSRIGDWEADLVIGKDHQGALLTLVERKTGLLLIKRLTGKDAQGVCDQMIAALSQYKGHCLTITTDNGKEFAYHTTIAQALGADFYFARPYHSWERGTNENTNGLIRQYFSKHTNFLEVTELDVQFVLERLNNHPRKRLQSLSPNQALNQPHLGTFHEGACTSLLNPSSI